MLTYCELKISVSQSVLYYGLRLKAGKLKKKLANAVFHYCDFFFSYTNVHHNWFLKQNFHIITDKRQENKSCFLNVANSH